MEGKIYFLFILICFVAKGSEGQLPFVSKSFVANKVTVWTDDDYVIDGVAKVHNPGTPEYTVDTNITVTRDLPKEVEVYVATFLVTNGQRVMIGPPVQKLLCDYIVTDQIIYPGYLKYSNFPKSCPLKAKKYILKGYSYPVKSLPLMQDGNYELIFRYSLDNKKLVEHMYYFTIQ